MTLTGSLLKSTVVAALGGLLFGFDTAVIAGTTAGLTKSFSLTPSGLGVTVAVALIGTVVGGRPRTANTVKAGREKNKPKREPAGPSLAPPPTRATMPTRTVMG